MSKPKAPELPATPSFYQDPYVSQAQSSLMGLGQGLTSSTVEGLPSILRDTVSFNPQITQLTLQSLASQLSPYHRQGLQDITNTLEANNQLTGSTTANALTNFETDYGAQLVSAGAQAGIADINRALQNRVGLYGTGLNTIQAAGQLGTENQSQRNQFNLSNYENQVAQVLASQKQQKGGFAGALSGAAGGALAGLPYAAATGGLSVLGGAAAGGLGGYFGPSGTGGSFLQAGAGLQGARLAQPNYNFNMTTPTSGSIFSGEQINSTLYNSDPFGLNSLRGR